MPWEQRKARGPEQEAGRTVPSLPGWPVGETELGEMGKDACGGRIQTSWGDAENRCREQQFETSMSPGTSHLSLQQM